MPIVFDDVRKLATIETIERIDPIVDADAIVKATVRGWTVVVKKNEFNVGDRVVYFEEDTALPLSDPRFEFLRMRGSRTVDGESFHVLKIAKLRGTYSQGLVLPFELFSDQIMSADPNLTVGDDVTAILGLGKFEPPVVNSGNGDTAGLFLTKYARKTDSERIQNLIKVWDVIKSVQWDATEKVDGASTTVIRDEDGVLRVCSRNLEVKDGDNVYWDIVKRYPDIFDTLVPNMAVQFESVGIGIQGNRLKLNTIRPFIFDVVMNGQPVGRSDWDQVFLDYSVPEIKDFVMPDTPQDLISMVDGMKSLVNPNVLAEGIVFHTKDGSIVNEVGSRNTFKVVSQKYLLKG